MSEVSNSTATLSQNDTTAETTSCAFENDYFCGRNVTVEGQQLRVKHIFAEGGYSTVYLVQDFQTGKEFALKRLIGVNKQECEGNNNEIELHKQLSGHPHIVTLVSASITPQITSPEPSGEYLLLMELCKGGTLRDYRKVALEPSLVMRVFQQAADAVAHMHKQSPPITHRDIKLENYLLNSDKQLQLCDFGSATKQTYTPTSSWTAQQRKSLEKQLSLMTTPIYCAPEVLDTSLYYEICTKVDIWALGCILYELCFRKHPFEDATDRQIAQGVYDLHTDTHYFCFHELIKGCLTVNPSERFSINMVLARLATLAETRNWSLKGALELQRNPVDNTLNGSSTNKLDVI